MPNFTEGRSESISVSNGKKFIAVKGDFGGDGLLLEWSNNEEDWYETELTSRPLFSPSTGTVEVGAGYLSFRFQLSSTVGDVDYLVTEVKDS